MSREDVRLEGYVPGNGFQPALRGISRSDVLTLLAMVAYGVITGLLRTYLGNRTTLVLLGAVVGALLLVGGTRQILHAERYGRGKTEKGARQLRIVGIVLVVIGTAVLTLAVRYFVFVAEGW